jgi:hypothetical protein
MTPMTRLTPVKNRAFFEIVVSIARPHSKVLWGYPVTVRKKMCDRLVTYQHSAKQQFEKPGAPRAKVKEM